eukprot:403365756
MLPSINNASKISGLRSNNIAFQRADDRPYQKELSQYVKSDRDYQMNNNNPYNNNVDARQSIQSQRSGKGSNNNAMQHTNMVDQILASRMSGLQASHNVGFQNNTIDNNPATNPFLKSEQYRLSHQQLEDRQMAVSRASNLQMEMQLQQHDKSLNQSIGSRGSQRLPPLRQSSSRGQLGGSLKPLHLDETDINFHSQQNTRYPMGLEAGGNNSQIGSTKSIFQSQLGKVATTVQARVNVFNEGEDEIRYNTVNKILDDELDQGKIQHMEQNLANMKEEIELAKYKYEQKQLNDLEMKEREMLNKIDDLEDVANEDHQWRHAVRDRLIQMKLQQKETEKREKQYEDYIHKMERESEVEKLVRKKLEIEKMREQQELLQELHRKKENELKGIGTQLDKKDVDSSEMLKKALLRADVLQKQIESGTIDTKTQALLVDAILDKNPENEMIRKQILEEIKAKMFRDKDDQKYKNEELMQQLNMQRMRFQEAEKVIKEKKQMHQEIMRRGLDFLTEIELGNAPPLEYVVKNIYQSRIDNNSLNQQDGLGQAEPVKQTVQNVKQNLRGEEQRLKDLMNEYNRTMGMIQSTELKLDNPDRYRVNIPEYKRNFVQPVLDEILDNVFRTISNDEVNRIESKKTINRLKMQKDAREARIDQLAGVISLKELNESLIGSIVEQMAKQIAQESIRLNDLAMLKSFELIVKALKTQKGFKNSEPEMRKTIMGMQGQHLEERKMDIHKIHHSLFVMSGQNAGRLAEIKVQTEQQQEQKKDKNMKDEDFIDENADVLDPSESLTFINNQEVKQIERDYFGPVNIERCQIFGGTLGNKSGGVTAITVSHNKQLVAQAINNGQIQVFNIAKNYQLMRKIVTKNTSVYTNLEISRDNFSQIIATSIAGSVVKSFLMKDKNELPPVDPNQSQGKSVAQILDMRTLIDDQTVDLVPYFEVNYELFLQPDVKKDKNAQKEYAVTTAQFHSQISQTGFQDFIIVGSKNGSIIRYNANPPQSQQQQSQDKNNASSKEMFNAKNANVDFILGHKVPIVFLQSIENPTNPLQSPQVIVSIDVAGHVFIWKKPQDREKFPSKASAKYRIALSYNKFVRAGENRLFPQGKDKEVDAAKSINAKILTTITNYMQTNGISSQEIESKCIDKTLKNPAGVQIMIMPIQRPPENDQLREFEEFIFNNQGMLTRRSEVKFKFEQGVAKLGAIKSSKNKRFIVIQLLKDHVFAQKDFITQEFIIFRSEEYRLGKYKVSQNVERTAVTDFDIGDEVQSLGFPYLYFLNNTQITIVSILTNTIVKQFDYAVDFAKLSKKKVKFDRITVGSYQDIFLNSTQFDATLHIKLENLNSPERHTEFVRLYSKLNECWK